MSVAPSSVGSSARQELDGAPSGAVADSSGREPLVSVCLPAFNGARWIEQAIESVRAQTYERLELVVSDGGSSDGTARIARSFDDDRIRVFEAPQRLGAIANWNRSVALATGEYLKLLHQDDTLEPTCIEEMVALARTDPEIGLVFAPRRLAFAGEPTPEDRSWQRKYTELHRRFRSLERVNDGRALFRQILAANFEENWVGEPSSVLLTRRCLARIGLFSTQLRQVPDLDLWCRAMLSFRVGFVDRPLSTYLVHGESLTRQNERAERSWLDRLWLSESLLAEDLAGDERAALEAVRREALRAAGRAQVGRVLRGRFSGELVAYAGYRLRALRGAAPPLHPPAELAAEAGAPTSA